MIPSRLSPVRMALHELVLTASYPRRSSSTHISVQAALRVRCAGDTRRTRTAVARTSSLASTNPETLVSRLNADGLEGAQFLLGDNVMMAPVMAAGASSVSVYFPVPSGGATGGEEWVHWASGER
jgi:hypothetical protein